jgi:hypothetical protein
VWVYVRVCDGDWVRECDDVSERLTVYSILSARVSQYV